MNTETKACPMCGETILAVAKKCKHCQEYLEINDESSKSNEFSKSSIYSKVKSSVTRLINTNYESGDKNVYSTKKIPENIDGEIKNYLKRLPEYDANYATYKIIKNCENINLKDIINKLSKDYMYVEQEYIEKILNDLICYGGIYKHDFGGKVVYSAKSNNQRQESSSKFNKENNRVYSFIKKYGTVRLAHIKESLSIDNLEIEKIVNNLVANGDICKNNINNEVCCSVNKINQEKNYIDKSRDNPNVDDEIKRFLAQFPEYDTNYEIYKYIKECKNVTLNKISSLAVDYLDVKEEYVERILDGLIELGFIYKYYFRDEIYYSLKEIDQKHKLVNELTKQNDLEINSELGYVSNVNEFINEFKNNEINKVYKIIKKHEHVSIEHIAKSLSLHHLAIKNILDNLTGFGFIYKYDIGDKIFYSTKDITNKIKPEKAQKPSTKDDIDINDPEINKFLDKKPLPDIPEKLDINGTENNDELHSEELSDDIENNLSNENESNFDLDRYMSEEDDSNHN